MLRSLLRCGFDSRQVARFCVCPRMQPARCFGAGVFFFSRGFLLRGGDHYGGAFAMYFFRRVAGGNERYYDAMAKSGYTASDMGMSSTYLHSTCSCLLSALYLDVDMWYSIPPLDCAGSYVYVASEVLGTWLQTTSRPHSGSHRERMAQPPLTPAVDGEQELHIMSP